MLESVVTWKWRSPGYRSQFAAEHVNMLREMVARHYPRPHRFICVTDDAAGLDPEIEVQDIGGLWADIPNPSWKNGPSCYRRLSMFAHDAGERFGNRFVSLDLDCVVTGDLRPVFDRPESIVLWSDPLFQPKGLYCGSMVLLTAGAFPRVFDSFDPAESPRKAKAAGCMGSDQGWITYCLGPGMPVWTVADGVYSFWVHVEKSKPPPRVARPPRRGRALMPARAASINTPSRDGNLPPAARIVFFHGARDPWHADVQAEYPWVREHYSDISNDAPARPERIAG